MKAKLFSLSILTIALNGYGQEAGKAGKLIPNELEKTGQRDKSNTYTTTPNYTNRINSFKNDARPNARKHNYNFNYTQGNSELFLRIPEMGRYTIKIGEQMVSNATGKYRFFDIQAGDTPIYIYRDDYLIYHTNIFIPDNKRVILDFFSSYGLYLLDMAPVRMQSYGFNSWDEIWNIPYNSGQGYVYDYPMGIAMNHSDFNRFVQTLRENSFDDDRLRNINMVSKNTVFYAKQIAAIVQTLSFDSKQIEVSKQLYNKCIDPYNYDIVINSLKYTSSKREVQDYIINNN